MTSLNLPGGKTMKKGLLVFITVCLALSANACAVIMKQTQPITSNKRTCELLDIHSAIAPQIPFDKDSAKIIFFSDLHRGMGPKDVFRNNTELFRQILSYYYDNGFTLVLIGDVEEGWGFQRDNIPLILDAHKAEFEIENKFQAANRYYRIYGNHDDFFRGQLINFGSQALQKVYPAIIFNDQTNHFNIFITHGCQGQGLHDAGDELASWGVFAKYNWWLELFPKKLKSVEELYNEMALIQKDLQRHEDMVFQWALNQKDASGLKKYNLLVTGHTHIPVFNSIRNKALYEVIKEDIVKGKYIFFNDIFEQKQEQAQEKGGNNLAAKDAGNSFGLPYSLKEKMLQTLDAQMLGTGPAKMAADESPRDPFYFNTGCGFHSKITCIEISGGKIYLKLLGFDESGKIDFDSYVNAAELKNY
jgi:UDP-2,3-diacylglucosamine pyrophosphatase LpxH